MVMSNSKHERYESGRWVGTIWEHNKEVNEVVMQLLSRSCWGKGERTLLPELFTWTKLLQKDP